MKIKEYIVHDIFAPSKLIFRNKIYQITDLDEKFIIKKYKIKTVDSFIDSVYLYNPHPNANPRTGEFCIPPNMRLLKVNKTVKKMIGIMLCNFNLDDCYFTPWNEIEYQKTG